LKTLDDNRSKGHNTVIKGSPGCGKSLTSWGWAFKQPSASKGIVIHRRDDKEVLDFDVTDIKEFGDVTELIGLVHSESEWLFTSTKYHGGFDVIHISQKGGSCTLNFFQITISGSHSLTCSFFKKAAEVIANNLLHHGTQVSLSL
jgi:hypothetical protein